MTVKRFVWVRSKRGSVKHMAARGLDAELTRCGRVIVAGQWQILSKSRKAADYPECADCARSAKP